MLKLNIKFFSSEELLLGLKIENYKFCDGKDEETNKFIINDYTDVSLGFLFFYITLSIKRGN